MSLVILNEKTGCTLRATFTDENDAAVTPTSGHYWIYDITDPDAPVQIKASTAFTPSSSTHDFEVLPTENRILAEANGFEKRQISIDFAYGSGKQGTSYYEWGVRNLHGIAGA
jgi:hypothetical protein